jgi:methylated-DNA-protein-cysteine methyltransferase-like protein
MSSRARIYEAVRRIPRGRVSTYGDVAAAAGLPGHARQVGYALAALETGGEGPREDVPWHRVVNAKGRISPRGSDRSVEALQRALLRSEGVRFHADAIDLQRYRHRNL